LLLQQKTLDLLLFISEVFVLKQILINGFDFEIKI
jgi:hypothetical protein